VTGTAARYPQRRAVRRRWGVTTGATINAGTPQERPGASLSGGYAIGNRRIDRHQTSIGMAGLTQPPRLLEFSNRFNLCYIHSSKTRSQEFPLTAVGDDNDPRNT
jgi:hypothetical protein